MMLRRALLLIGVFLFSIAAVPVGAQKVAPLPRVVMIVTGTPEFLSLKESFLEGMRQAGQIEGRTFVLQMRYGTGEAARNVALVKEAVAERPDVLVVGGFTAARNARDATSNAKVARSLGIAFPQSFLLRADRVIE